MSKFLHADNTKAIAIALVFSKNSRAKNTFSTIEILSQGLCTIMTPREKCTLPKCYDDTSMFIQKQPS